MYKMGTRFCPKCRSENVVMVRGDNLLWKCVDCDYQSAIFPEKEKLKDKTKEIIK